MQHLGDITKLHGKMIPQVDIITFGAPCQDLSMAGFRKGLQGEKSSLFFHAIRIIKEMRNATNGKIPTLAVWKNVMGAFSFNQRMDFQSVLETFTEEKIPMPASGKWCKAGMVRSNKVDLAWRVLDAQYGEFPSEEESFSWQILEDNVAKKYYLDQKTYHRFLQYAKKVECSPPERIKYLLKKQSK